MHNLFCKTFVDTHFFVINLIAAIQCPASFFGRRTRFHVAGAPLYRCRL